MKNFEVKCVGKYMNDDGEERILEKMVSPGCCSYLPDQTATKEFSVPLGKGLLSISTIDGVRVEVEITRRIAKAIVSVLSERETHSGG